MKQHSKPCSTCPFSVRCESGALGGGTGWAFIGQAYGPFYLPCHSVEGYNPEDGRQGDTSGAQCAGAAIFRANVKHERMMSGNGEP